MFTSRAEYRMLLRQDNADIRLTSLAHQLGLADEERMLRVKEKVKGSQEIIALFKETSINPDEINGLLTQKDTPQIEQKTKLCKILARPQIEIDDLMQNIPRLKKYLSKYDEEIIQQAEINMKYEGYIKKEKELVEKMNRLEDLVLSPKVDYKKIPSLSNEAKEKLSEIQPRTIGQATRISGVSPADVSVLMVYMGR